MNQDIWRHILRSEFATNEERLREEFHELHSRLERIEAALDLIARSPELSSSDRLALNEVAEGFLEGVAGSKMSDLKSPFPPQNTD